MAYTGGRYEKEQTVQNRGRIITFEGINGVGKTTQAHLLARALEDAGNQVRLIKYPQYEAPVGELIRRYLKGEFGPKEKLFDFAAMLYAADRAQNTSLYEELLSSAVTIIHDRYKEANWGILTALFPDPAVREEKLQWLLTLEKHMPSSDLVIYLDLPVEDAYQQMALRELWDTHEVDRSFMQACKERYDELSLRFRWVRIAGLSGNIIKSTEDKQKEILEEVFAYCPDLSAARYT